MKLRTSLTRTVPALTVMAICAFSGPVQAADGANSTKVAADKTSMCIGCHGIPGYKASYPQVYHVPMIAGQNADYIVAALKEYASGARTFPTMEAIARTLSPTDMANLAAYYSGFKK
jgi:cytochrome c553